MGDGERGGGRSARITRREGPIGERHVLVDYLILTLNVGSCTLIERAKTREVGWVSIGQCRHRHVVVTSLELTLSIVGLFFLLGIGL